MDRRTFVKAILGTVGVALVNPIKLLPAKEVKHYKGGIYRRETDYSEVIKSEDSLVNINRNQLRLRIRKDITRILKSFTYEPNSESTRKAIASTVADYLEHLNAVLTIQGDYYTVVQDSGVVYAMVTTKKSEPVYCFVNII